VQVSGLCWHLQGFALGGSQATAWAVLILFLLHFVQLSQLMERCCGSPLLQGATKLKIPYSKIVSNFVLCCSAEVAAAVRGRQAMHNRQELHNTISNKQRTASGEPQGEQHTQPNDCCSHGCGAAQLICTCHSHHMSLYCCAAWFMACS
jgi:hypothetical protein